MTKTRNTKRALLLSALALLLSVSMLVGSTFAWFTDSVTSSGNKIISGKLDVDLIDASGVSLENETLQFVDKDGNEILTQMLWEPGCTYTLEPVRVKNNGNLWLKYEIVISGIEGDAKLREAIEWTVEGAALKGALEPNATTEALKITGHMKEEAGNEYQELEMAGISITVYATQMNAESDSFGPDYDKDAWHPDMKVYNAQDLQAALTNAEPGDVIALENDIELTEAVTIPAAPATFARRSAPAPITINLNGKTLTNKTGYIFESSGNVVITGNGTLAGRGGIRINGGSVVVENGNFYNSSDWNTGTYEHALKATNAVVTINGGNFNATVNGQTNAMLNASENAVITINGGNFKNVEGAIPQFAPYIFTYEKNGKVVINDGTFYGGWRFNGETTTTDIYGGNFTISFDGQSFHANSTHKLTVYGGNFAADAKFTKEQLENCLADAYKAVANTDGTYTVLFPQESFDALIENAGANGTIEIPAGSYIFPTSKLEAGMTLNCAPGTVFEGTSKLNIEGATIVGATFSNPTGTAADQTIDGKFVDCVFEGQNGLRWCYAGDTVEFENCVFSGSTYGVHFDGGAKEVTFKDCTISGFNATAGSIENITFDGCTFVGNGKSAYNGINLWGNGDFKNCTFVFDGSTKNEWIDLCGEEKTATFTNCVVTDGTTTKDIAEVATKRNDNATIVVNGAVVAHSVANLDNALAKGENAVLVEDMSFSSSDTKANSGYGATGVSVMGGVLDGNGHKLGINNWGTWDAAVHTTGGTIKNLTINSGMRGIFMGSATADVKIDNVTIDGTIYTFNSDGGNKNYGVYISNSTLNGWTSHSDVHKEVVYTNCSFGEGQGYAFCRPYGPTQFIGCDFAAGFQVDAIGAVTFENCTIGGVALTAENLGTLVTGGIANATVK